MNPQLERPPPPYAQIADHFRRLIHNGTLPEGARLPSVVDMAREFSVSNATAARAIATLQGERLVYSSPRGTRVAGAAAKAVTPQSRVLKSRHDGLTSAPAESHKVTAAEITAAVPEYIPDYLGLDDEFPRVVRREWITSEGGSPRVLTVTWYPAALAETVPVLLSTDGANVGQVLGRVEGVTGTVTRGRDWIHARVADHREATALRIPTGTAILAGTWMYWADGGRLVEYGEYCLPPRHTLSYPYDVQADGTD